MSLSFFQPSSAAEAADLLASCATVPDAPLARRIADRGHITESLARGNRRAEWTWAARRGGRTVARVALWGAPGADLPDMVDLVDVGDEPDRVGVTAALLRHVVGALAARGVPEVETWLPVPTDWRTSADPDLADLRQALEAAGGTLLVARRRYRADRAPGPRPHGLGFAPVPSALDPLVVDLVARSYTGTLDEHSRTALRTRDARDVAREDLEDMATYNGPSDGWRVALRDGVPVGVVTGGGGSGGTALIGYVGVVPEARGRGIALDLLTEQARILFDRGATAVAGETDDANTPMQRAFERAGFVQEGARLDHVLRP